MPSLGGAFCLVCISIATFHTCFTPLCVTTGARNMYTPTTRTSTLNIYSILLSVTELCATYIFVLCVPSKLHIYNPDQYRKRSLQSWCHALTGITNQPPVLPSNALRW
jgi:hypothetical protein